jgi:hypothetical protein
MDFVTHQAMVKQQGKDTNLACAFHQKEIKKKENQKTLGMPRGCFTSPQISTVAHGCQQWWVM